MCLNVPVEIFLGRTGAKAPPELTKTLIVSAHGALILLNTPVAAGDLLNMKNVKSNDELACRVVDVSAGTTGAPEVGLEFLEPARNFWHVAFPPADWSPRGPESKIHGPQAVANLTKGPKR